MKHIDEIQIAGTAILLCGAMFAISAVAPTGNTVSKAVTNFTEAPETAAEAQAQAEEDGFTIYTQDSNYDSNDDGDYDDSYYDDSSNNDQQDNPDQGYDDTDNGDGTSDDGSDDQTPSDDTGADSSDQIDYSDDDSSGNGSDGSLDNSDILEDNGEDIQ